MKNLSDNIVSLPIMSKPTPLSEVIRTRGNEEVINQIKYEAEYRKAFSKPKRGFAPVLQHLREAGHKAVIVKQGTGLGLKVLPDFRYRQDPNTGKKYIAFEIR